MSRDYLDRLAEFAVETRLEDLDPVTVSAAKNVALDTIGAMLAGSRQPENANLAQLAADLGGDGKSTLLGSRARSQAMLAALANATAGVSLGSGRRDPAGRRASGDSRHPRGPGRGRGKVKQRPGSPGKHNRGL